MRRTPTLIVGGGPAGSAAAIALAANGHAATIFERDRAVGDALCGGFLSWRTLAALDRLGIAADTLNPRAITRLTMFAGDRRQSAPLPAPARAVSRHRLDTLLIDRAASMGAGVERGVRVRDVGDGQVTLSDGAMLAGGAVLLATGKHELHAHPRLATLPADPVMGLRVRLKPHGIDDDTIELHLFDRGYAGLAIQEDGRANLCLAVARSRLRAAGSPQALLADLARENPALAARLDGLDSAESIDAIANVPYGWVAPPVAEPFYRLGDQVAVIPSLAGEGMGIAIASGVAAARAIVAGRSPGDHVAAVARAVARPMRAARAIRRIAEAPRPARALVALSGVPWLVRMAAELTRISQPAIDEAAGPAHI